jgi:polyisoprenyl-teichoic acid--peptidoglycan teichoic acid transferase
MIVEKRSRLRRLLGFVAFRLIPVFLILGILVTGYQVAQGLVQRVSEQSQAAQRQPFYQQTATALALPQPTPAVGADNAQIQRVSYYRPDAALQFETNTPLAPQVTPVPAETLAPTLPETTPRALPTLFMYDGDHSGESQGGTAVPSPVPTLDRHGDDLMNILLLGNDGQITNDNFLRTDTMIIVSINRTAGTVALLSLPRDLYVYIPGWTMQRLNLAYIHGEQGQWPGGGFGLLRQTILYNFGINVHYYAMVGLDGFKSIVDAVGGVNLAVDCAIEDLPLVDTEIPKGAYKATDEGEYVLPVGYYSMTGAEALWYARSRGSSSDFDRGVRQQQVLRAVWRKAKDTGLLNNIVPLWNEGSQNLDTDMTLQDVLGLVPMALNLDPSQIETYEFARTYDTTPWQPPDGSNVQLPNYDHMLQRLNDFYTPPTNNQLVQEHSTISVLNGTTNSNWDLVAAQTLSTDGFNATAGGAADNSSYVDTILIDHTGRSKGSSAGDIAHALNVKPENIRVEPDPNRTVDFEVILGGSYTSCPRQGVLPVDPNPNVGG